MSDATNDDRNDRTDDEAGTTMDGTESTEIPDTTTYGSTTTYDTTPGEVPSGRHPVNVGHLVMGLAFAGLVVIWALIEGDVIADRDIRWLLPIPWVLAGTAGLLAVTLGNRRRRNSPAGR
ncbi:MAG: hypothetical protein ABWX84_05075 [Nocardioides sp.]